VNAVYLSGMPPGVDVETVHSFAAKCGIVKREQPADDDLATLKDDDEKMGKLKIKLYLDEKGIPKGDATVTYLRVLLIIVQSFIHFPPLNPSQSQSSLLLTFLMGKKSLLDTQFPFHR